MTRPTRPPRVDESTAEALRRGDPHAFEDLYVQLRGDVYNLAARIVGDRREAEDITQEVFLRAFRHLPGKADQARPDAWVFRTTVNACYDHLRRRTPTPVDAPPADEAHTQDAYAQAAMAAAVEETLGRLEPRYRTALVLKDLHGLANSEIAEIMGVARGTVGVLLFRARNAFKKRYRDVAPTLGASLPGAGLAVWLPPLALPASLATAFTAPLAAPLAASPAALAPLGPAAATAAPVTAGLAKLAGALTSKVAVVAVAATAVTGGGIVAYEAHDASRPAKAGPGTTAARTVATGHAGEHAAHGKTHAALAAGAHHHGHGGDTDDAGGDHDAGHGGAHDGSAHTGGGTHDGGGGGHTDDSARAGEKSHTGDRSGETSGSGSGETAHDDGSGGSGGTHDDDRHSSGEHE